MHEKLKSPSAPKKLEQKMWCGAALKGKKEIVQMMIAAGILEQRNQGQFDARYPKWRTSECEDRACVELSKGLMAVFDGVGGNGGGGAEIAKEECKKFFKNLPPRTTNREIIYKITLFLRQTKSKIIAAREHGEIGVKTDTTTAMLAHFIDAETDKKKIAVIGIGDSLVLAVHKTGQGITDRNQVIRLNRPDSLTTKPSLGKDGEKKFDELSRLEIKPGENHPLEEIFYFRNVVTATLGSFSEDGDDWTPKDVERTICFE